MTGCENVYCVELPGNGELNTHKTPTQIEEAVSILQRQLPTSFTSYGLIGISLGGMLATHWAQQKPQQVSHLVIINSSSSLSPFYQRMNPVHYLSVLGSLISKSEEKSEEFILRVTSNHESIWRQHLKPNIDFAKKHPVSTHNFIKQIRLASQADFTQVPQMPKLILTSDQDHLVSSKCSQKIAETWKCSIQTHPTAGHDLTLDDPAWVIQQIKSF